MTATRSVDRGTDLPAGSRSGDEGPPDSPGHPDFTRRFGITPRLLQIVLGGMWIIVGLFKFQPDLFGASFIPNVIGSMADGQPGPIAASITHMSTFLSHEPTWWVAVFGLIEVAIGVGIIIRRTARAALVISIAWGLAIYWFGEGFGGVLTGTASPLTGAPGAACFYALLAVLLLPSSGQSGRPSARSSAFGSETEGPSTTRRDAVPGLLATIVWAVLWIIEAGLWLFPANRASNSISSQLSDAASGEPHWYASFLTSAGHAFIGTGAWMSVILAGVSLVIAFGPLFSRRPRLFVSAGIALTLIYWVTGGALGMLPTLAATDFGNGPIITLIGLWVLLELPATVEEHPAAATYLSRNPMRTAGIAAAMAFVLIAICAVPADKAGPAGAATMSGTASGAGMQGMSTSDSHPSTTSAGMQGMSMSGSQTAGDGKRTTMAANPLLAPEAMGAIDPSWHYFGPALPRGEARVLKTISADTDRGHDMQTPSCTATPTARQLEVAIRIVQDTSADLAKYQNLDAAVHAGYIPVTSTAYQIVHYVKPAYMNDQDILNPNAVDSLVYATTPYGPVLAAAMYLLPRPGENGPMPAGCMLQWHAHANLCHSLKTGVIVGFAPCPTGEVSRATPYMAHVWQVPVPGGPLALDPSDLQTVEAAIMAQQCGEAPFNPSTPPPPPAAGECKAYFGPNSA